MSSGSFGAAHGWAKNHFLSHGNLPTRQYQRPEQVGMAADNFDLDGAVPSWNDEFGFVSALPRSFVVKGFLRLGTKQFVTINCDKLFHQVSLNPVVRRIQVVLSCGAVR